MARALTVAAFTGGREAPSARFRVRQYAPALAALGVQLREYPHPLGSFPPPAAWKRPFWAVAAVAERAGAALRARGADVSLIQREMVSSLLTAEWLTRRPRVLDVDDAIWLHGRGSAAQRLARLCDWVVCGSEFLAERFRRWSPRVAVLPTAVDTARFAPVPAPPDRPRLGWSGSSSGFRYLRLITPALREILNRRRDAVLRIVSDREPALDLPPDRIEFIPWSESVEVTALQQMTVGLMPLDDSEWSRGKCSFKLLCYAACGVPAVASPVGMNREVLEATGGVAASSLGEWVEGIDWAIVRSWEARARAAAARRVVEERYSLAALAPRLARILRGAREEASC
jgi:glycosyltransferase involved in cell wall biosynthesis